MSDKPYYEPVLLKRQWIPDWFYKLFSWDSGIWLLENAGGKQPWRWLLHRQPTEFEKRLYRVPIQDDHPGM